MLKAADAAAAAGWRVHVVASSSIEVQREMDDALAQKGGWSLTRVEWGRARAPFEWWRSRIRRTVARTLTDTLGARVPMPILGRASSRAFVELTSAAAALNADLYYGGGGGGTLVAAAAASAVGAGYAIDFEDLHSGESPSGSRDAALWNLVEERLIDRATFVTAGSTAIANFYAERHGRGVSAIHNTFPLPASPPVIRSDPERLRFYWVGQTIGPGRGIEEAVEAVAATGVAAQISLRGAPREEFVADLRQRVAGLGGLVSFQTLPFSRPEDVVRDCADHDVGVALEPGNTLNNRLLLSNKALTYVLAGVAPLLTATPGHAELLADLGPEALAARPGDRQGIVDALGSLADRDKLMRVRHASWTAAVRRWHWEHPDDRGRLLDLIGKALA